MVILEADKFADSPKSIRREVENLTIETIAETGEILHIDRVKNLVKALKTRETSEQAESQALKETKSVAKETRTQAHFSDLTRFC